MASKHKIPTSRLREWIPKPSNGLHAQQTLLCQGHVMTFRNQELTLLQVPRHTPGCTETCTPACQHCCNKWITTEAGIVTKRSRLRGCRLAPGTSGPRSPRLTHCCACRGPHLRVWETSSTGTHLVNNLAWSRVCWRMATLVGGHGPSGVAM